MVSSCEFKMKTVTQLKVNGLGGRSSLALLCPTSQMDFTRPSLCTPCHSGCPEEASQILFSMHLPTVYIVELDDVTDSDRETWKLMTESDKGEAEAFSERAVGA